MRKPLRKRRQHQTEKRRTEDSSAGLHCVIEEGSVICCLQQMTLLFLAVLRQRTSDFGEDMV